MMLLRLKWVAQDNSQQIEAPDRSKLPEEDQSKKPEVEQAKKATPAEEPAGSTLLKSVVSASKSLERIVQLELSANLLEALRADSATLSSLTAGVNYYASVSKASQASASSGQKALASDWLSSPSEKTPLKEVLKSIRYHSEQTTKASYEPVTTAKDIADVVHSQKETMVEQCQLLKTTAENQKNLAEYFKAGMQSACLTPPPPDRAPPSVPASVGSPDPGAPMVHGPPSTPSAPPYMSFGSYQQGPPPLPPVQGRFAFYQPVKGAQRESEPSKWCLCSSGGANTPLMSSRQTGPCDQSENGRSDQGAVSLHAQGLDDSPIWTPSQGLLLNGATSSRPRSSETIVGGLD